MVFCSNCGARNEDGTAFCAECGAPLQQAQNAAPNGDPQAQAAESNPGAAPASIPTPDGKRVKKFGSKLPLIIGIAVAAVVIIVLALVLFTGRNADATAIQAVEAVFKPNTEKIFLSLTPKKVLNEFLDQADYDRDDLKDECEDMDDAISDAKEDLEDALDERLKFSYKVRRSKDLSNRDLKNLKGDYDDEFGVKVSAAKNVTVRVTVKAGKETEHFDVEDITIIKVGGKWYVELESFVSSIYSMESGLDHLF